MKLMYYECGFLAGAIAESIKQSYCKNFFCMAFWLLMIYLLVYFIIFSINKIKTIKQTQLNEFS